MEDAGAGRRPLRAASEGQAQFPGRSRTGAWGLRAQVWVFPALAAQARSSSRSGKGGGQLSSPSAASGSGVSGSSGHCWGARGLEGPTATRPHGRGRGAASGQPRPLHPRRLRGRLAPSGQRRLQPGVSGTAQALADRVRHQVLPLPPARRYQVCLPRPPFSSCRGETERAELPRLGLAGLRLRTAPQRFKTLLWPEFPRLSASLFL